MPPPKGLRKRIKGAPPVPKGPNAAFLTASAGGNDQVQDGQGDGASGQTAVASIPFLGAYLPGWMNNHHVTMIALFLITALTRYWNIERPDSVVFDEFHFGKFVNWYMQGKYFFDIHPPLGKLTFVLVGWLGGYDPETCQYDQIHQVYKPACSYLLLRRTAAFFGCLLPPLTYMILVEMGTSTAGGVLGASLVIFDMLNLIESRLILTDSQLMFYCALSLYVALRMWKRLNYFSSFKDKRGKKLLNAPVMSSKEENLWCLGLGMACGAAVSVKWTALATPGLIAVESFFAVFVLKEVVPFRMLLKIAAVVFAQYTLWFAIHFWMLPYSGDGDLFMPIEFQRTLIGGPQYDPNAPAVPFWYIFPELNREMLDANARIDVVHSWASRYYQWVLNQRGVLYWSHNAGKGLHQQIYLLGNPIVLWMCLGGVVVFIASYIIYLRSKNSFAAILTRLEDNQRGAVGNTLSLCLYCFICYMLNLLPYIAVERSAFCYHYMPGLFYAELLLALFMDRITRPYHVVGTRVILAAVFVGFVYWSPWVYAFPLPRQGHDSRRWMASWN